MNAMLGVQVFQAIRTLSCVAFLSLLMLFAGCATQTRPSSTILPPSPSTPAKELNEQRRQALTAIRHWSFKGRAAVQRGNEGWSATLHWDQHEDAYRLRMIAPLGRGTYEVLKQNGGVSLIDPTNNVFKAGSPEELLAENLGWNLPISDIEFWVRGLLAPGPAPTQLDLDEGGLLKDFAVRGWRVSVLDYFWKDSIAMPRKLFINYGDMKIRLVISKWDLGTDGS